MSVEAPLVCPRSRGEWRAWLEKNHARVPRIWLVLRRKGAAVRGIEYTPAIEEALCFGWIDSVTNRVDEQRWRILFGPRKPRSVWSAVNKKRIEQLLADGRMAEPGLHAIEAAKQNGSWETLDSIERLEVPDDLRSALAAAAATDKFDAFSRSSRKGLLGWIGSAKTAPTREKRIAEVARLAAAGLRAQHPESRGK